MSLKLADLGCPFSIFYCYSPKVHLLRGGSLGQKLLDGFLLLEKEGSDNALADAGSAAAAAVCPGNSLLPFLEVSVGTALEVLDSGKADLAIGATRALGLLDDGLGNKLATRSTDGSGLLGLGVVRVASNASDTGIRHL